jgi:hypothetical protein
MTNEIQNKELAKEVYAYTPGLKVKNNESISKMRLLPIPGMVLFNIGDKVDFETVIARTSVPGNPIVVKVYERLNINPENILTFMTKKIGDEVEEGEIIAQYTPFWGLIKRFVYSPVRGSIEAISEFTGQVVIREPPTPLEIKAYIPGIVSNLIKDRGVSIETNASFIQGIFGIGGEKHGKICVVSKSPNDILTAEKINSSHTGKILIGGSIVTLDALRKAIEIGACGIIVGGIRGTEMVDLLGYEIGVAITGHEDIKTTIIILEGFGRMAMSHRTFNLLKAFEGYEAAINGETQIRAGVIRPEIIIPHDKYENITETELSGGMKPGTTVRIIREPYFGEIGMVVSLPVNLQEIETESQVRVIEVKIKRGNILVPRANVEIIEE